MAGFTIDFFKGIRPLVAKTKLPIGEAQTAENTKLGSADLKPWYENATEQTTDDAYNTRTIYLYINEGVPQWFEWSNYVDVTPGPIKGDDLDRVYYTGDGRPKITYNTLQSGAPFPSLSYDLGVPKPTTRLTAVGQELPEDVVPESRRTSTAANEKLATTNFEIVFANFTVYPGTGTPNDTWRIDATSTGDIIFQVDVGDTFRVLEVLDDDTVRLGSATGTGAVGATAANDKSSDTYWHLMDEQGSTQAAEFTGWRIPDGMKATIPGHLLRIGDVIRVTRLDLNDGFEFTWPTTSDLFELTSSGGAGDWGVPTFDSDAGVYRHENVLLGASDDGLTEFELNGGFYYDVDRTSSVNDSLEDRSYVYTFVSSLGEEGPPSDPSALVQALDGDSVSLTGFDLAPEGFRDIEFVRVYRTNATAVGTEYQFVKEVSLTTISANGKVVDTVEGASLGEVIETTTYFPPPVDMQGITSMPNGMMVGFRGKDIFFCEPYQPHAWPPEYDQAVDYDVVALAPFGNSVAVLTKGTPYVITGSHPRNANIRPYKINQACTNKESVALAKDKVYYASPDGLVEIGVNGAQLVTENFVWKDEWTSFEPATMVGEFHDNKYFGFFGADNTVTPQPTGSVAATGTLITSDVTESDIIDGALTLILTLTGDTWAAAGSAFDLARDDIIFSITSSGSEIFGWNNVRVNIPVTSVVRTSDTVVTITLPALPTYSIVAAETLSFAAPAIAVAGQTKLIAPETTLISEDSIYSTEALVVSGASTTDDLPTISFSNEKIDTWQEVSGPGGLAADDTPFLTDAAYHTGEDRWVAVGYNSTGANINNAIAVTSDDIRSSGTSWVARSLPTRAVGRNARAVMYEDITDAVFMGGNNGLLLYSYDCINWSQGFLPPSLVTLNLIKFARAPQGNEGTTPKVYGIFENSLRVGVSADLNTLPLSWTWTDLGALPNGGTACTSIASGNGRVFITNDEALAEIGYVVQGEGTYTEIGNLGMPAADMTYGNGRLVVISSDGRIQYADAPNEGTIGNWSAVSTAIDGVGTRDLAKIEFDGGDDTRIGYGFIATLSATGVPGDYVIYTSPDAVTWTLRDTVANTSDAIGIGVKYPEDNLSGDNPISADNPVVTLSGQSLYEWGSPPPIVGYIFKSDGSVYKEINGVQTRIDSLTDWIIPNFAADGTYDVRITNVVFFQGSIFQTAAAVEDTWIALSADRKWAVQSAYVRFTVQIRKDAGAVLSEATYSVGSEFLDPNDRR